MASYDGAPGRTRKQRVHYTCPDGTVVVADVYVSVDADADPELAQRLMAEDPAAGLNVVRCPGERAPRAIAVPVVYHAPGNEIIVLVLPESCRHRELHERATLMSVMAEDTAVPVPAYARDFRVVYGGAGLRSLLEGEAERALAARREAEQSAELAARAAEVERREQAVGDQQAELDRLAAQLDKSQRDLDVLSETLVEREAALDRRSAELERTTAEMATLAARAREAQAAPIEPVADESPPVMTSAPRPRPDEPPPPANETVPYQTVSPAELLDARAIPVETHDEHTDAIDADLDAISLEEGEVIAADQVVGEGVPAVSAGAPVSQDGETRIGGTTDVAIERWIVSRDKYLKLVDDAGLVRLAICADGEELELLMGERLGLKIQLHPLPSYPLVTVTFGSPAVVRGDEHGPSPVFFFDVKAADDRAVLDALSNAFTFRFELFDSEHLPVKKRTVTAELAENVRYILAAADARLTELAPAEASFDRAIIAYDAPDYDRLGARHRERREFRPDKLDKLARESEVRRAMAIVRRFSLPELEEYLVAIRG